MLKVGWKASLLSLDTIFKGLLAFEATFPARLAVLGLTRRS